MGKNKMKPKRVWVYLGDEQQAELETLMRLYGAPLKETDVIGIIFAAGLKALKERNYQITLPLRFNVVNHAAK